MWLISRVFGWKFDWGFQVPVLVVTLAAGAIVRLSIVAVASAPEWALMLLAVPFYVLIIAGVLWLMPSLAGVERRDLLMLTERIRRGA
jgi:hypothetical protein